MQLLLWRGRAAPLLTPLRATFAAFLTTLSATRPPLLTTLRARRRDRRCNSRRGWLLSLSIRGRQHRSGHCEA